MDKIIAYLHSIRTKIVKDWLLFLVWVIPNGVMLLYVLLMMTPQYTSESIITVVSAGNTPEVPTIGSVFKSIGGDSIDSQTGAIFSYLTSAQSIDSLEQNLRLKKIYSDKKISLVEKFDPIGLDHSNETFREYITSKITTDYNTSNRTITISVTAFDPVSAAQINRALIKASENKANEIGANSRSDAEILALDDYRNAKNKVSELSQKILIFRQRQSVLDTNKQASTPLAQLDELEREKNQTELQLGAMAKIAPLNPSRQYIENRIKEIQIAIHKVNSKMLANNSNSLVSSDRDYQNLINEKEVADGMLEVSTDNLRNAKLESLKKHIYVETVSAPYVPDRSNRHGAKILVDVLLLTSILYGILKILIASAKEHID